jgi:hypothetical protein
MKVLIALVGFLSNPGTLMQPPGPGFGGGPSPPSPFAIVTEDDQPLTTEASEVLETEDAP